MSTSTTTPAPHTRRPTASVPGPAELAAYAEIDEKLPSVIVRAAIQCDRRAFIYALVGLVIGGLLAFVVVAGFIYLIMQNHPEAAGSLLGVTVAGMIAGFRSSRL